MTAEAVEIYTLKQFLGRLEKKQVDSILFMADNGKTPDEEMFEGLPWSVSVPLKEIVAKRIAKAEEKK